MGMDMDLQGALGLVTGWVSGRCLGSGSHADLDLGMGTDMDSGATEQPKQARPAVNLVRGLVWVVLVVPYRLETRAGSNRCADSVAGSAR